MGQTVWGVRSENGVGPGLKRASQGGSRWALEQGAQQVPQSQPQEEAKVRLLH